MGARVRMTWLATIAVFCGLTAQAHAYVYWTDDAGTIGRANLDGSGVDRDWITGAASPRGIAVDEDHLYWVNAGSIGRADVDGSDVDQSFIADTAGATGLAVDGSYLYWTGADAIGRASLDGSHVDHAFVASAGQPRALAVNDHGLYWSDATGAIRRADLDGSGAATLKADAGAQGLAVDDSRVVWATGSAIFTGGLDLAGPGDRIDTVAAHAVALDAQHVFWATTGGVIGRTGRPSLIPGGDPRMLAVDGRQSGTVSASASTLTFGIETVGALGARRTLTVTNTGPGELQLGVARVTGTHAEDFLLGPDTCSGAGLAVGATCTVAVFFAPDAAGDRAATLSLSSNDAASPLAVALSGTGEDDSGASFDDEPFGFDDEFGEFDEFDDSEAREASTDAPVRARLVTCRIVEVERAHVRRCRSRHFRGASHFTTTGTAHATLTRRGVVYATGTAGRSRAVLDVHRRVRPGRYTLTLRKGGRIVRRVRVRIR